MLAASTGSSNSSKYIYHRQPLLIAVLLGCSSGSSSVGTVGSCGVLCGVPLELWRAVESCGGLWSCGVPLGLWDASGAVG